MLGRNFIEVIILLFLAIIGVAVYFFGNAKIRDAESDICIRRKEDILDNMEDEADINTVNKKEI